MVPRTVEKAMDGREKSGVDRHNEKTFGSGLSMERSWD
jgi:hypothetical protein